MEKQEFHKQSTLPHLGIDKASRDKLPEKIGPYKIESLLSASGMSLIYLGIDQQTPTPLALKVLSPKLLTHQEMVNQFLKEAEIIGMTDHPNIVQLHGQGEWEKGLYIATEFIRGVPLRQFIIQQNLSLKSALDIILQVSYALLHLHTHGVIHRDLKPENILITDTGQVKVIDFGIAQLTLDKSQTLKEGKGRLIGTPNYMSPEQKKDPMNVNFQTDIFSLGIITYELIVGKLSFGSVQLSLLPKGIQRIVKQTLEPSLDKRYQDIVDFITDLSKYLKEMLVDSDRIGLDEVKEMKNNLNSTYGYLLSKEIPKWPQFDMGLSLTPGVFPLGIYYDFIRLAGPSYLIVIADTPQKQMESIPLIGILKGMIRALSYKYHTTNEKFKAGEFVQSLNQMLIEDKRYEPFAFNLVYLSPQNNQFTMINCGFSPCIHGTLDSQSPKLLEHQNPLLAKDYNADFFEIVDNWEEGDSLYLHTFNSAIKSTHEIGDLDKKLLSMVSEVTNFSSKKQSEVILDKLNHQINTSHESEPKFVITIERIS